MFIPDRSRPIGFLILFMMNSVWLCSLLSRSLLSSCLLIFSNFMTFFLHQCAHIARYGPMSFLFFCFSHRTYLSSVCFVYQSRVRLYAVFRVLSSGLPSRSTVAFFPTFMARTAVLISSCSLHDSTRNGNGGPMKIVFG